MADLTDLEAALRLTQELLANLAASNLPERDPVTREAYGRSADATPDAIQRAVEFKRKLSIRDRHLQDYYVGADQEQRLKLFKLFTLGVFPIGDYNTSVSTFRTGLERERALLQREIAEVKASGGGRSELRTHGTPYLGEALYSARRRKGHSQEDAASQIGCSTSTISRIERGLQSPRKWEAAIQQYIKDE